MKKMLAIFSSCFLALAATAQNSSISINSNPVQVEITNKLSTEAGNVLDLYETEFNFGRIPQGKPVTHVFEVRNNGKEPLRISDIQASCGCTTPEWDREKTPLPGENTSIRVGYNALAEGSFNKQITINYNNNQTKHITIKGEVWKTPSTSAPENKIPENLKD